MSHATINQAAFDPEFRVRIDASIYRELVYSEDKRDTTFGKGILQGFAVPVSIYYQIAVSTEAKYESALLAGRGAPGHDQDIISDADITAAVNAAWPSDEVPPA